MNICNALDALAIRVSQTGNPYDYFISLIHAYSYGLNQTQQRGLVLYRALIGGDVEYIIYPGKKLHSFYEDIFSVN